MYTYFLINHTNNTIIKSITTDVEFDGFNTKNSSNTNKKNYIVPVSVIDPVYDSVTHIREDPIDSYDGVIATRVYTIRPKTEQERLPEYITLIKDNVQNILDTKAQEYGYDNIYTAVTYDDPIDTTFQTEALAFKSWRSLVWRNLYTLLSSWQSGAISEPTIAEIIDQLPTFNMN